METQLCLFLQWKRENIIIGWSALKGHIYAIRSLLLQNNIPFKTKKHNIPRAWAIVTCARREQPTGAGADALTIEELQKLIKIIYQWKEFNSIEKRAWVAIITLAFYGMKRISEYAYNLGTKEAVKTKQLEFEFPIGETKFEEATYFSYNRTKGKTYQYGGDLYATFICTCKEDKACALCPMKSYIKDRITEVGKEVLIQGNLFHGEQKRWSKWKIGAFLKKLEKKADLGKRLTGHTFRKSGAQHAITKGVPLTSVCKQADWSNVQTAVGYNKNISRKQQIEIQKRIWK